MIKPTEPEYRCLQVVANLGGRVSHDAEEILPFCDDASTLTKPDVFNRCHDMEWLRSSHDDRTDCSFATLTDKGREAIALYLGRLDI